MKISVIVPSYNSASTIEHAIKSIPNNPDNIEIIVIDDGSTDNTQDIIKNISYTYTSIKLISQENQGAGAAREKGVLAATGDYITFLDSDDLFINGAFDIFKQND